MKTFFELIKIKHWVKNFFVFAPLIFALQLFNLTGFIDVITTFFCFSFIAVSVYIINDIKDRKNDAVHPEKSKRPIASGKIGTAAALTIGSFFFISGILLSLFVGLNIMITVLLYFTMNILYTFFLKNVIILDIFIIAIGFCLRVLAGSEAIDVELSNWMLLATFSVSLIIGFGKRRHELSLLGGNATEHRKIFSRYNKEFLDMMIIISTAITAISYALYTMDDETVAKLGTDKLIFTFPFVLYFLYRYLHLIYMEKKGGNPEELVVTDIGIIITVILYLVLLVALIYFKGYLGFLNNDIRIFN